jgi:chaperonin cofactor prefoldin
MTLEKLSKTLAKRAVAVETVVSIDSLIGQREKIALQLSRLQASIDMWQSKLDALDAEIGELRALGVMTSLEAAANPDPVEEPK